MPIMLNTILQAANFNVEDVRLLRHQDNRAEKGRTPYELWRDNRQQFDVYQATQAIENDIKLRASYWVSFVGTPYDETMFVGIYRVRNRTLLDQDTPKPHMAGVDKAGSCYIYDLVLESRFDDLIGRMLIDWGLGARAWIQRADKQNKKNSRITQRVQRAGFSWFFIFYRNPFYIKQTSTKLDNGSPKFKRDLLAYLS